MAADGGPLGGVLVSAGLAALGLPGRAEELAGRGRWRDEKALVAALVRERTGIGNACVAARLAMGHEGNATRAVRRVREEKDLAKRFRKLKEAVMLESRD